MKSIHTIALVAALSGCAQFQPTYEASKDPTVTCMRRLSEDPFYASLDAKVGLRIGAPTMAMMADKSLPTDAEKALIDRYSTAAAACRSAGSAYRRGVFSPQLNMINERSWDESFSAMFKLYQGQIDYGQFNQEAVEIEKRLQNSFGQTAQSEAADASRASAERSRAVAAALTQSLQQQQAIQAQQPIYQPVSPIRMPTTTNCQRWGNQVNCTTY